MDWFDILGSVSFRPDSAGLLLPVGNVQLWRAYNLSASGVWHGECFDQRMELAVERLELSPCSGILLRNIAARIPDRDLQVEFRCSIPQLLADRVHVSLGHLAHGYHYWANEPMWTLVRSDLSLWAQGPAWLLLRLESLAWARRIRVRSRRFLATL